VTSKDTKPLMGGDSNQISQASVKVFKALKKQNTSQGNIHAEIKAVKQ